MPFCFIPFYPIPVYLSSSSAERNPRLFHRLWFSCSPFIPFSFHQAVSFVLCLAFLWYMFSFTPKQGPQLVFSACHRVRSWYKARKVVGKGSISPGVLIFYSGYVNTARSEGAGPAPLTCVPAIGQKTLSWHKKKNMIWIKTWLTWHTYSVTHSFLSFKWPLPSLRSQSEDSFWKDYRWHLDVGVWYFSLVHYSII